MKRSARRLFFALNPDDALRNRLKKQLHRVLPRGAGRPVPATNLHITLVFLGHVEESGFACVEQAGDAVVCSPFRLVLDYLGHWPRPRILWLGPQHTPAELFFLVGALRSRLQTCDIKLDQRPYQAHMTVMRKVGKPPSTVCTVAGLEWSVERFSLMESVSEAGGVRYHEIRSWPLRKEI